MSELSIGPDAPMTPVSRVSFSTSAETLQSESPSNTTFELVKLTAEIRPTKPSLVKTGRLTFIPSRLPRSICTVRHQLAGSRKITRPSLSFQGVVFCQL